MSSRPHLPVWITLSATLLSTGCPSLWDPFLAGRAQPCDGPSTCPDGQTCDVAAQQCSGSPPTDGGALPVAPVAPGLCPTPKLCWWNPLPQGNTLRSVFALSSQDVWTVGDRGTATFTLVVQNDGNVSDTITVAGLGSTGRFSVRYLDGATDVTASVGAGTFAVTGLAPGATHRLTLTIKARAGTAVGASLSRLVTATSSGGGVQDAVMATVTRR